MPIKKTGWTYLATRENEKATDIARHFIGLFRKALADRNCRIMCGIEDEFYLDRDPKGDKGGMQNDFDFARAVFERFEQEQEEEHKALGRSRPYGRKQPHSSLINPHNATDPGKTIGQFKTELLDHQYEITYPPSDPERAAMRYAALRKFLYERTKEGMEDGKQKSAKAREDQKRFGVRILRADPIYDTGPLSQQISASLWMGGIDPESLDPSLQDLKKAGKCNLMEDYRIAGFFSSALRNLSVNDAVLVLPTQTSYQRIDGRYSQPPKTLFAVADYKHTRVEYRLPDAAANPFFTALMAMAAAYMSLDASKGVVTVKDGKMSVDEDKLRDALWAMKDPTGSLPKNLNESMERFGRESALIPLMKAVAEIYGTKKDVAMADEFQALVIADAKTRLNDKWKGR